MFFFTFCADIEHNACFSMFDAHKAEADYIK